jgi:quinoprotein glucose dehydrogenase
MMVAAGITAGVALLALVAHVRWNPALPDPAWRTGQAAPPRPAVGANGAAGDDWPFWGNDAGGSRYSRLTGIDPANVANLEVAWTYRTGDRATSLEVTPLKIGDTVYLCTGANDVIALDAESGAERWRFAAGVDHREAIVKACRGVAYYRVPDGHGPCAERIYTNTLDARLIALDAKTGSRCGDFGQNGEVSLRRGMGDAEGRLLPGYYYVTSAPTIVRGRIVLGGWVADAQYWGEPSGVIRAYDAVTGAFVWAFDMGRPDRSTEPPPGEQYTPSTPNAWAPMSADESLGLVFVPTGNTAGSDYYGALRRPFDDAYSSAVVALDIATGRPRWKFQTVHHDLWDYDVAPQPVLVDLPRPGGTVPALVQATKTGEIFVLDRVTGRPLSPVTDVPAPIHGAVPEERVSATQPASLGLPAFRGPDLEERDMWGVSPWDQLWCRLKFRAARYEGLFTPPGLTPSLQYPGILGGIEWSSVAIDMDRGLLFVNASRVAQYVQLLPRAEADARGLKPHGLGGHYLQRAQAGTPYALTNPPFLSPLSIPCQRPPYGTLSAMDLGTGRLLWTQPLGTARDSGPLGMRTQLPFTLGTPTLGGALVTRSGLVFIAATPDRRLRAFRADDGALLWQGPLPAAALATPMTYRSTTTGRQFVVVAAGGSDEGLGKPGDFIVAFALPAGRARGVEDR